MNDPFFQRQTFRSPAIFTAAVVTAEIFVYGGNLLFSPGYLMPFLSSKVGLTLVVVSFIWQAAGFWLVLSHKSTTGMLVFKCVLVTFLCVLPFILIPMLGPAAITIMQAFGPLAK